MTRHRPPLAISDLLANWLGNLRLTDADLSSIRLWESLDEQRLMALALPANNLNYIVQQRLENLRRVWQLFERFCKSRLPVAPEELLLRLWFYWLPLAERLGRLRTRAARPIFHGIVGPPAAGKSTLAGVLALILESLGYRAVIVSLDDLYWPFAERKSTLQRSSRLRWRGPPGTHDIELGRQLLSQLQTGKWPVKIPRFDKTVDNGRGDRTGFETCTSADIVLFEGWFVGLAPRRPATLERSLRRRTSRELALALDANRWLAHYEPLWEKLDDLLFLYVPVREWIRRWRIDTEEASRKAGLQAMPAERISHFIDYLLQALPPVVHYRPLLREPGRVNLVIRLDHRRRIRSLRVPGTFASSKGSLPIC